MPYKTGKLKGELLVSEIRKLVRLHNKLSKIKIPPRSSRDDIIKIVEDNGYKIDHKNQKLTATRMNKDLTLKEAQETFPVKKRVKKEPPKPAEKPKPKKEDEVRPAKKPFPPIPKNIRGKRVNVKFGKPPTKERIETGKINVGKVDTTKPKIKIKIKKEKKVKKPTGKKVKKAVEKIEKKEEPKKKKTFGIDVEKLNRKQLKEQAEFIGVSDEFATDDELRKKIKDEIKRIQAGMAILCSSEIKRLLNDLRDILLGNEKYAEIAKGYGKEKLKYADYRKNFIEGANEILKNHKKYKRECTESELTEIRKGLKIMEDSPTVQKFNKRTPTKEEPKKEEPKKKAEPKKAEPKKKKVNFDKIEEGLEDMDDETSGISLEIKTSKKYSMKKPNFTEKEVFEDTKYKNMKDLERQFDILKNMSDDLTDEDEKQIALNLIENIRDRLPFIKDNIK